MINSKQKLQGELESNKEHFHFHVEDDIVVVERVILSWHDGLGKKYIEGHRNFPVPRYVCDYLRGLQSKYLYSKKVQDTESNK